MPRKNPERSVVLPQEMAEALDSYSAKKRITTSQAIRQFIEKGLSITSYEQSQTEIRNYIREEIETVMPIVMKRYMERLIAMQAVAARTSAAALQCCAVFPCLRKITSIVQPRKRYSPMPCGSPAE